jgi:hypothetical protein
MRSRTSRGDAPKGRPGRVAGFGSFGSTEPLKRTAATKSLLTWPCRERYRGTQIRPPPGCALVIWTSAGWVGTGLVEPNLEVGLAL